jgi:hypothetical protein
MVIFNKDIWNSYIHPAVYSNLYFNYSNILQFMIFLLYQAVFFQNGASFYVSAILTFVL